MPADVAARPTCPKCEAPLLHSGVCVECAIHRSTQRRKAGAARARRNRQYRYAGPCALCHCSKSSHAPVDFTGEHAGQCETPACVAQGRCAGYVSEEDRT